MATTPKKAARALPTLTEVVTTPRAAGGAPARALDEEALIAHVLERLELSLEAQVRQVIAEALQEQMQALAPRIRQRVDTTVRRAAAQAVALELKRMTR